MINFLHIANSPTEIEELESEHCSQNYFEKLDFLFPRDFEIILPFRPNSSIYQLFQELEHFRNF